MEDVCPDAWLFNYSNPLPRVTWSLKRATKIKTVGLCHGVMSGINGMMSILGTKLSNIDFTSAGLNHFYWIIKARAAEKFTMPTIGSVRKTEVSKGDDLLPHIRKRGIIWAEEREKPFIAELLRIYGYLTYPSQSHPAEYIPWSDSYCPYVKYDFKGYAEGGDREKEKLEKTLRGEINNYWWVQMSGERAIHIISGIEHDTNQHETAVNVRNNGAITNLRDDCIVEVPAIINKSGIHAEKVGSMPDGIAQLLQQEAAIQDLVSKAAITGDHETAIQALTLDGTVPNPESARSMFYEMLDLQKQLLPQFH